MAIDAAKNLERAKKYLEKNKIQEAIQEYQAVLEAYPANQEVMQSIGDLYIRKNEPEKAAQYYGMLFDRLVEARDVTKASVLYTRFLKPVPQPPDRIARFAVLLQKQNKTAEAIEYYNAAAESYVAKGDEAAALTCWEKIAQLDPDNPARHVKLGEAGERLHKPDVASRGYLRAGQLALAGGETDRALEFFSNAHRLAPADRSVALFYADGLMRKGIPQRALELLEPFSSSETDPPFLDLFGQALTRCGQFDRAREVFEQFYRDKPDTLERLFELAEACAQAGQEVKCAEVLSRVKERMFSIKKQNEFAAQMDRIAAANPKSIRLAELAGQLYNELNRETKYFDVLGRLFDLYLEAGNVEGACESLERLVDIDPYDIHNQELMTRLEGKVDAEFLRRVSSRMAKAANVGGAGSAPTIAIGGAATSVSGTSTGQNSLDDLIVQAEIFIQYSLRDKAVERLQRIAELFPGEEARSERLRTLYNTANWWPPGAQRIAEPVSAAPGVAAAPAMAIAAPSPQAGYSAETLNDLGRISEITRAIYRQTTPKTVLSAAVNEIGKYLRVARCLAVVGPAGQPPQMASEFCVSALEPSPGNLIVKLLGQLGTAVADALGGLQLDVAAAPVLRDMGLQTVLGVQLTDKEAQSPAGMLIAGHAAMRAWKPNESYFLQAVGDQMIIAVNHTKMRSMMRNMGVSDEKTGLLGRSSYLDCLLSESNRARTQGTPLSVLILQMDRGPELVRQQGEPMVTRYLDQLAQTFQGGLRQTDVSVKYTSFALAFILPDTLLANAKILAEKLRKLAATVRAPWDQGAVTLSGAIVEAIARPDYDGEDIVTEMINRVETGLEEARQKGGNIVLAAASHSP